MKKYIFYLLAIGIWLATSGCEDFLNKNNPTATTDEKWWNLESDVRNALEIIYYDVPSGTLDNNASTIGSLYTVRANSRMHLSAITDEAVFKGNYSDWQTFPLGQANSASTLPSDLYKNRYEAIRTACRFLENYQKAYVEDASLKTRFAAEARALRAFYHMDLFMYFGPIPIVDKSLAPTKQQVKRNTQEEVVNFVVSELEKAAADLPVSYPESDAYRMTKGTCYALESILYLYLGDYARTIEASKKVMDLKVYELHTSTSTTETSYASLFSYSGLVNKERIMFRRRGQQGVFFRNAPKGFGAQATTSPTLAIVNTYETKQGKTLQELGEDSLAIYTQNPNYRNNRDPRLAASVLVPGETFIGRKLDPFTTNSPDLVGQPQSTQTGFWMKKYLDARDVSAQSGSQLNFMSIRYAEILLNYVEALIESGQWQHSDVTLYLNMIRKRAGMPNVDTKVYNSQAKMRELLRRERQVELAFEGQRFFDIKRWKIGEQVLNGTVYGAYNPGTKSLYVAEQRKFDPSRDYMWPIPLTEINVNPLMTQNPNW